MTGGIKRSNRFPNDSFFGNWTSTDGVISWAVDVAEGGTFEAQLFYTCAEANVGSKIELRFNENSLVGKVTQAVESDLIGAEEDRSPRM